MGMGMGMGSLNTSPFGSFPMSTGATEDNKDAAGSGDNNNTHYNDGFDDEDDGFSMFNTKPKNKE
eukprot:Awhi_evm1s9795